MDLWTVPALIAMALVLGVAVYAAVRWRRAPAALRAIGKVSAVCFVAGFLAAVWAFHLIGARDSSVGISRLEPPRSDSTSRPSAAPSASSDTHVDSQLSNANLMVRPGILDFGDLKVGKYLECMEHAPKPLKVVSEKDSGYGEYTVRLENIKHEWMELDFVFGGDPSQGALLRKVKLGNGESFED